ncbi:unnamed protein product [Protopolystoma xenopodis]|uniref:Uncharacterized protein n=1 Tax=Protopolystoma xenopodis TaxID=117903 RepID=A0A3S5A0E1_9PLAT|nr:unnamed protein product [Protopolystoma xenopodis]
MSLFLTLQARHYNAKERAGLIPSIVLQERRKAFAQSAPDPEDITYKMLGCRLGGRRKKKVSWSGRCSYIRLCSCSFKQLLS